MRRVLSCFVLTLLIIGIGFFSFQNKTEQAEFINNHIIQRHIAKTEPQLQQRLQQENISAASSFYNSEVAQRVIEQAIAANEHKLKHYLMNRHHRYLTINYRATYYIGVYLFRDQQRLHTTDKVKVVIAADPATNTGYRIITAYPIP